MTTTAVRERPILFQGELVRAIIAGRKTVTRRPVKPPVEIRRATDVRKLQDSPHPEVYGAGGVWLRMPCPYGVVGDRLWVRETWWHHQSPEIEQAGFVGGAITRLGDAGARFHGNDEFDPSKHAIWRKRPSIFMPRWAARLVLEVTDVRVERLREITIEEVEAEGISAGSPGDGSDADLLGTFRAGWDQLYRAKPALQWAADPWTWRIAFKVVEPRQ